MKTVFALGIWLFAIGLAFFPSSARADDRNPLTGALYDRADAEAGGAGVVFGGNVRSDGAVLGLVGLRGDALVLRTGSPHLIGNVRGGLTVGAGSHEGRAVGVRGELTFLGGYSFLEREDRCGLVMAAGGRMRFDWLSSTSGETGNGEFGIEVLPGMACRVAEDGVLLVAGTFGAAPQFEERGSQLEAPLGVRTVLGVGEGLMVNTAATFDMLHGSIVAELGGRVRLGRSDWMLGGDVRVTDRTVVTTEDQPGGHSTDLEVTIAATRAF